MCLQGLRNDLEVDILQECITMLSHGRHNEFAKALEDCPDLLAALLLGELERATPESERLQCLQSNQLANRVSIMLAIIKNSCITEDVKDQEKLLSCLFKNSMGQQRQLLLKGLAFLVSTRTLIV